MSRVSPLQIAFLDVGHGDTIVISTIEDNIKRAIIIDCNDAIKTKNYILENEIQVIDYIVITHLHQDHYKGVNAVIDSLLKSNIEIKNICWEKDKYLRTDEEQKSRYKNFTAKLDEYHINKGINYVGKRFEDNQYRKLDNGVISGLTAQIIYPNSFAANHFDDRNVNNTSAVIQINYNNFKIVLPGDLEGEGWHMLKANMPDLKCDILKVPHHGGYFPEGEDTLSLGQVIDCSSPKFAIISTGQNDKYKHPSKETIECLANKNISILCTQVTNLCDRDRLNKRECIMSKLGITTRYKENNCPCVGDIIFEIDDEIKIISHTQELINEIRESFTDNLCTNI